MITKQRKKTITWLFLHSQKAYTRWFKKNAAWGLSRKDLLAYPADTLGRELGHFLKRNKFELIPKVEQHDIYHLLTGYGTAVEDEIALQYLCLGNGKVSLYLIGAILIGTLILPEHARYYRISFSKGKQMKAFHQYDYLPLLKTNYKAFCKRLSSRPLKSAYCLDAS